MSPTRPDHLDRPHVSRLSPGHPSYERIVARHRAAVDDGAETYVDPATGYRVFTAARLAARGTCCDTGCRHCPYVGA
jgi:hypothetical protein